MITHNLLKQAGREWLILSHNQIDKQKKPNFSKARRTTVEERKKNERENGENRRESKRKRGKNKKRS